MILLLVYHFKNRMAIAEKKSESMYGLLSAVVKEIKSLRGMFGLGGETTKAAPSSSSYVEHTYEVQSKSEPEVIVPVTADPSEREYHAPAFVPLDSAEREVITLDLNASEPITPPKIIVSDVESEYESEYESESGSDLDESNESDAEDYDDDEEEDEKVEECPLEELNVEDLEVESPNNSEHLAHIEEVELSEVANANVDTQPLESTKEDFPIPSNDQLRKMNINQLKSIAILQNKIDLKINFK